jgi:hypothetical protein
MNLRGIEYEAVDWIDLAQNIEQYFALINVAMNFQVL